MNKAIPKIISICIAAGCVFFLPAATIAEESIYSPGNTSKTVLSNGITVILHEVRKSPIVSIDILVKCGSGSEGRYEGGGISHLTEHLLFKSGNEKETNIALREIKSFGGTINGFTTRDYTVYTVVSPKDSAEKVLDVLRNFVFFPKFDTLEINNEKEVILDEIRRSRDNPASYISQMSWALTFQDHPYKYPVIGYDDLFERITKEDVEYYFSHNYSPDNMIMAVSGDITREEFLPAIEKIFSNIKRNFVFIEPEWTKPQQFNKRTSTEYRDIRLAYGALSYRTAPISDPSLYAMDVLAIILGDGEGSVLTRELRDNKKIVYSASCYSGTLRKGGLFYIPFVSEPDKADMAFFEISEILERVKRNGVGADDLEKAKKRAKADFVRSLQTAEGRAMDLISNEALTDDYAFSQIYLEKIDSVNIDDIKSAAAAYFDADRANMALLIPNSAKEKMDSSKKTNRDSAARDISNYVLPNGIRIIVCEDHTLPICTISAIFLGGVRFETKADNGVSHLMANLMLDGTNSREEEDIKAAIESTGGDVQSISGMNSFGITISLMSVDWKKDLDILSDCIVRSAFADTKIEKEKALTLAAIKERDDSIVESGLLLFRENFFRGNPYNLPPLGFAETIKDLKKDDILKYYGSFADPSNMIIAATGDINKEDFVSEIKRLFANTKKAGLKSPPIPSRQDLRKKQEVTSSMNREQSIILIGFPAVKFTDADRYTFEVIDSIMSGSDGRLFNNVRSSLGISYSLGSLFMPGIEPGCHIFYAVTTAKNIGAVKEAIFKEIKKLKGEIVSEKELDAAKRHLIASNIINLEDNSSLNLKMAFDELYGLGCNNFEAYETKINSVTAGQIKRVANQYLNTDECLIVTVYGKKEGSE